MEFNLGDQLIMKKQHPCGSNSWTIVRTGADVKIKCNNCGKIVMLSLVDFKKGVRSLNGVKLWVSLLKMKKPNQHL